MYFDYHDGKTKYTTFFMDEWLPFLRQKYHVNPSREATWLTGISMGGCGSLRLGFLFPEVFGGLAAMEPAIDPAYEPSELLARNLHFRQPGAVDPNAPVNESDTLKCYGGIKTEDWDADTFQRFNPVCIARSNAQNIREAGLKIYLEAADQDFLALHDGAEFLHQVLWQYRIQHEYHLNTEADHLGPSIVPRQQESLEWLGKMMQRALFGMEQTRYTILTEGQKKFMDWMKENRVMGALHGTPPGAPEGSEAPDSLHIEMLVSFRGDRLRAIE